MYLKVYIALSLIHPELELYTQHLLEPTDILFGKLPWKIFHKNWEISAKIHEIGKIKAIFGLGMSPIKGCQNGQIKSLTHI